VVDAATSEETGVASVGATVTDVPNVVGTVEVKPSPVVTRVAVRLVATTLAPGVPLRPLRTVEPVWVMTAPAASVMVVVKRLVVTAVGVPAPAVEVPAPAAPPVVGAGGVSVCGIQLGSSYQLTNCTKRPRTYDGRDGHTDTSAHAGGPLQGEVQLILVVGAVGPGAVVDAKGKVGVAAQAGHVVSSAAKVRLAEHVLRASSLRAGQ